MGVLTALAPQLITVILIASAAYMAWIGFHAGALSDHRGWYWCRAAALAVFGFYAGLCDLRRRIRRPICSSFRSIRFSAATLRAGLGAGAGARVLSILMQIAVYGSAAIAAAKSRQLLTGNPQVTITHWPGLRRAVLRGGGLYRCGTRSRRPEDFHRRFQFGFLDDDHRGERAHWRDEIV